MSHDQYIAIRRFIVRHIQDQDFAEHDGLPGRVLIQLCLERFYPDLEEPEAVRTEKKSTEGAIRRMVEDSMLQPVNKNQRIVFRLDPYFNIKDKMNATASQPSEDPQSTQEALEALEKERSPDMGDEDMEQQHDDDLDQQLAQQLDESMNQMEDEAEGEVDVPAERRQSGWVQKPADKEVERQQVGREEEISPNGEVRHQQDDPDEDMETPAETRQENQMVEVVDNCMRRHQEAQEAARIEATRHAEAYAEITRGAAPMPREQEGEEEEDEDPIRTPGRKRRRLLEIAASDASSSFDLISPGKYANSTPRRRMNRPGTPLSASRRRSAPTGTYYSPSKQRSPRDMEPRIVKEERTDTSPAWLKAKVNELRSEYPNSSMISENGLVKCLDCDGKTFRPTGNQSLHGFMTHLRSKTHQANAAHRQEKLAPSKCYFPTSIPAIDFNMAQAPLMVFANQRQQPPQDLASAASVFVKALEDDAHQRGVRTMLMEHRVQDIQKQNKAQQERINTSLGEFERQKTEQQELVSSILVSAEEKQKELSLDVSDRVRSVEETSKWQLRKVEDRMTASQEESTAIIKDMSKKLAQSDERNYNNIQGIAERVKESQKTFDERDSQLTEKIKNLKEINEGQNVIIHELELQLAKKTEYLQEVVESQNDKIQALQSQVGDSMQEVKKYQKTAEAQSNEIQNLRSKVGETTDQITTSKEIINRQGEKICTLELQLAEKMASLTKGIEAQEETIYDLESQCQLLTDSRQQHEKTIADQMEAHMRQTEKQISGMKQESVQQADRLQKLEEANSKQLKTIQSLVTWAHNFKKAHEEQSKILNRREAARQKFEQNTSEQLQILEKRNKDQQESIEDCEAVIPSIIEDFKALSEFVQKTPHRTTTRNSASPVKTRASV